MALTPQLTTIQNGNASDKTERFINYVIQEIHGEIIQFYLSNIKAEKRSLNETKRSNTCYFNNIIDLFSLLHDM